MAYQGFTPISSAPPWGFNPLATFESSFKTMQDLKLAREKMAQDAEARQAQLAMEQAKIAAEAPLRAAQVQSYMAHSNLYNAMAEAKARSDSQSAELSEGALQFSKGNFNYLGTPTETKAEPTPYTPSVKEIEKLNEDAGTSSKSIKSISDDVDSLSSPLTSNSPSISEDHPLAFAYQPDPTQKSTELLGSLPEINADIIKEQGVGALANNSDMSAVGEPGGVYGQGQRAALELNKRRSDTGPFNSINSRPNVDEASKPKNPLDDLKVPEKVSTPESITDPDQLTIGQKIGKFSSFLKDNELAQKIAVKDYKTTGFLRAQQAAAYNQFQEDTGITPDAYKVIRKDSPDMIDAVSKVQQHGLVVDGKVVDGTLGLPYVAARDVYMKALNQNIKPDHSPDIMKQASEFIDLSKKLAEAGMQDESQQAIAKAKTLIGDNLKSDPKVSYSFLGGPSVEGYTKIISAVTNKVTDPSGKPLYTADDVEKSRNDLYRIAFKNDNIYDLPEKFDPSHPEIQRLIKNSTSQPEGVPYFVKGNPAVHLMVPKINGGDIVKTFYPGVTTSEESLKMKSSDRFSNLNLGPKRASLAEETARLNAPKSGKINTPWEDFVSNPSWFNPDVGF